MRRSAWILSPLLTALILAYGISQLVRADSMSGASGTSIDTAACVTTTANSLCTRVEKLAGAALDGTETSNSVGRAVRQLFLEATAAVPVTDSMANRIIASVGQANTTVVPIVRPSRANGLTLTADAAWGTPGAYSEFVAANNITTDYEVAGLTFYIGTVNNNHSEIELGTGAGGSETVIGTFPLAHATASLPLWYPLPVPLKVTANTRLAARLIAPGANTISGVKFLIYPLPL